MFTQPGNGPSQFLLGLLEGSETLTEINNQFAPLMKIFLIYNFWEKFETNLGQESTIIVEFRSERLEKSHMETTDPERVLAGTHLDLFEIEQCLEV